MSETGRSLLAVLTNPPMTSGDRTRARVDMACRLLDFDQYAIANIFSCPSRSTREINVLGQGAEHWNAARIKLLPELERCSGVLLAYGLEGPSGEARRWHQEQLEWLRSMIAERQLPMFWVGGAPRHPSRWQRWTSRQHPALSFPEALTKELYPVVDD